MKEQFEKMLEDFGGFYTFDDIMENIKKGTMQSFSDGHSWAITQVHEFPRKKVVEIAFVIGDMDNLINNIQEEVLTFARSIGAELVMASGRVGWNKTMNKEWKLHSANYARAV